MFIVMFQYFHHPYKIIYKPADLVNTALKYKIAYLQRKQHLYLKKYKNVKKTDISECLLVFIYT